MTYEAHVTIEPVEGERFDLFERIANHLQFKPAHLLMMKDRKATDQRSNLDSFCTGHDQNVDFLKTRTLTLVALLKQNGFHVWRYKIEQTLLDVRTPALVNIKTEGH